MNVYLNRRQRRRYARRILAAVMQQNAPETLAAVMQQNAPETLAERNTVMCANNQTLAAVLRITDRDALAMRHYQNLVTRATRAALYGTDQEASEAAEKARRFAHAESYKGNLAPLIDQLERALD